MLVKDTEDFLKRLKRKPLATSVLALAVIITVGGGAWLVAYSSEIGRQAAASASDPPTPRSAEADDAAPKGLAGLLARAQPNQVGTLTIEQVTVGSGEGRSIVDLSIRNPTNAPVVVTTIGLSHLRDSRSLCSSIVASSYRMSDLTAGAVVRGSRTITGSFSDTARPEFRYPVQGSFYVSCALSILDLQISVSVPVGARAIQAVHLEVPNAITVEAHIRGEEVVPVRPGETMRLDLAELGRLTARVQTSNGAMAVYAIRPPPTTDGQKE